MPSMQPGAARRATRLRAAVTWLAPPAHDPDLAIAQLRVLVRQIPLLFIILCANVLGLAATHLRCAPPLLTVFVPAAFCLIGLFRARYWLRLDLTAIDGAGALACLNTTFVLVGVLGAAFTAWSLALYPYGDDFARCHVAFYMAVNIISCILCLTHLRGAALLLTFIVAVPFTVFFMATGNPVLMAMAANLLLVGTGLIIIMLRNYDDFAGRVFLQRETQRLSDENLRLSQLDGLTLLPNRRRFFAELDRVILEAHEHDSAFAVAIIDLDHFKSVNDTYGHAAGDRLLEQVGRRLASIAGPDLFIARLGGDEFGAILNTTPDQAAIAAFGARVKNLLEPVFTVSTGARAAIGCSIGIATYPQSSETAADLFERADYALYDGKENHKGQIVMFSPALEARIRESSQVERALRNADLDAELFLAFQPIVDIETGRTAAFECLARWRSPEFGIVPPNVFIPIAEHSQIINHITKILFAKMLDAIAACPAPVQFGFNLSAHDICSRETMAQLHAMIARSAAPPRRITFEITEGALLQDFDLAAEMIEDLHNLGTRVALDDFGVGFSSLGYVHRLKLDRLKVDRSFVADIEQRGTAPKIIHAILDLCRHLDLDCVVEGVESESQCTILRHLGARYLQGYHFSRPIPFETIPAFLQSESTRPLPALLPPPQRRRTMLTNSY